MTDRIKGFVVALDQDIRDDDVQPLLDAIKMLKHVITVRPLVAGFEDLVQRDRLRVELHGKLLDFIHRELSP